MSAVSDRAPLITRGPRPLRRALGLLVVATTAVTAGVGVLLVEAQPDYAVLFCVYALVGYANVLVGVIAWDRRPSNGMGLLLCVAGFWTLAAAAGNTAPVPFLIVGSMLAEAPIAALLHLLLAFPSGQLRGRLDRGLVVAGYAVVGLEVPRTMLGAEEVWQWHRPALESTLRMVQSSVGALVLGVAVVVMVLRVRSSRRTRAERRSLLIVYGYGIAIIAFLPISANVLRPVLGLSPIGLFVVQLSAFFAVPFVLAAGVLLGGFARTTEIGELGAWLGRSEAVRPPLRQALAAALGDPSLELAFRSRDSALLGTTWVDAAGAPAVIADPGPSRALVEVDGPNGPTALIAYDPVLIASPELVRSAGRVVALALERERLAVDLIASRDAVRRSRARLVEVGDTERRRMARDLHDLLQSRLVLAALQAGRLSRTSESGSDIRSEADRLRQDLEGAIRELRGLVHGVMPAILVESGLFAAAEELLGRQPLPVELDVVVDDRPLPPAVASTAYFVLAEIVSNAVKHADATRLWVRLSRSVHQLDLEVRDDGVGGADPVGNGLRGVADRVDALNGGLRIRSGAQDGTQIMVSLPCGS